MNFFKRILNIKSSEHNEAEKQEVALSLDDLFVHNFIGKGGKFLYCIKQEEILKNLKSILSENNWNDIQLLDKNLSKLLDSDIKVLEKNRSSPILTSCEHLIAESGDILFSSNQLGSNKIPELSDNFIVYATTSQLVKNTGEGLTGIKINNKESLPTNISAIKNYNIKNSDDNFLNYGNSNSKNLYLLLFEDL